MTYFFTQTQNWSSQPKQPQVSKETTDARKHLADKKNWRITELVNGI